MFGSFKDSVGGGGGGGVSGKCRHFFDQNSFGSYLFLDTKFVLDQAFVVVVVVVVVVTVKK